MKVSEVREYLSVNREAFLAGCAALKLATKADYTDAEVRQLETHFKQIEGSKTASPEPKGVSNSDSPTVDVENLSEQQKSALYARLLAEMEPKNAGQSLVNNLSRAFEDASDNLRETTKLVTIQGFDNLMRAGAVGVSEGVIESAKKYRQIGQFNPAVFTQNNYTALPTVTELKALMSSSEAS